MDQIDLSLKNMIHSDQMDATETVANYGQHITHTSMQQAW